MTAMWCRSCECTFPSDWGDCPSCKDDEGPAPLAELPDGVAPYITRLIDSCQRLEAQFADATERLEEREADMHARIRAGYDQTVADCWRAEVAKVTERAERAEARARELGDEIRRQLMMGYGVSDRCLVEGALATGTIIDVVTCECGARVEGQGRDPRKVRLKHRKGCLMLTVEALESNSAEPRR